MWSATKHGFYSAAQDRDDPSLLHVRTWVREDVVALVARYSAWLDNHPAKGPDDHPKAIITAYEGADYPWRVIMPKEAWADMAWQDVMDVDYDKFKPAVQGEVDRHGAYLEVFFALARLEFKDPAGRERPYMSTLGWSDGYEPDDDYPRPEDYDTDEERAWWESRRRP